MVNTSVKGNTNDINEEGTRVVRGFHLLIHNSLAKARYCRDPNGINPNSWPCPLFETRNPCIRPSANRRIYPTVPLQTFPARAPESLKFIHGCGSCAKEAQFMTVSWRQPLSDPSTRCLILAVSRKLTRVTRER